MNPRMNPRATALLGAGLAVGAIGGTAAALAARRRAAQSALPPGEPAGIDERIRPDTPGHRGGSGTPLLLIHGASVTWRTWKPVLPLLEPHHEVIAPTLIGHSGGPALAEGVPPSVAALVDGVAAELDALGLDRVHIAGNSLGGWIALELARRGRARSVVVFSPGGAWRSDRRYALLGAGIRAGVAAMDLMGPRLERLALTPRGRRLLAGAQFEHPERVDPAELIADIRALRASPILGPLTRVLGQAPLAPLPEPGCPVRVVWARRDRVIPFHEFGAPLMERLPTAELIMLDGVGHVPMPDDPETVSRLILEITAQVDSVAAGSTR
ncbi:MAG TPA: alpha/beta fold hydrolase [Pseudonocardia sp.]|jgi:pimeloyl-ACP methyl ester carboxylesterase